MRANLIREARSAQGKIDDYLKNQQKRKQRMDKANKNRKVDEDERTEARLAKAAAAQNYVKTGIRENIMEAGVKFRQQMAES